MRTDLASNWQTVRSQLEKWDIDKDGLIDRKEFTIAIPKALNKEGQISKEDCGRFFDFLDADGSGTLELKELQKHLSGGVKEKVKGKKKKRNSKEEVAAPAEEEQHWPAAEAEEEPPDEPERVEGEKAAKAAGIIPSDTPLPSGKTSALPSYGMHSRADNGARQGQAAKASAWVDHAESERRGAREQGGRRPAGARAAAADAAVPAAEEHDRRQRARARLARDEEQRANEKLCRELHAEINPERLARRFTSSYASELESDPKGIGFAYGGLYPGRLHAKESSSRSTRCSSPSARAANTCFMSACGQPPPPCPLAAARIAL